MTCNVQFLLIEWSFEHALNFFTRSAWQWIVTIFFASLSFRGHCLDQCQLPVLVSVHLSSPQSLLATIFHISDLCMVRPSAFPWTWILERLRQVCSYLGLFSHILMVGWPVWLAPSAVPCRHQAIIWTSAGILLITPLGTKFSEILIKIHTFLFRKMHLKMLSGKWRPFCLRLNVLRPSHAHEPCLTVGERTVALKIIARCSITQAPTGKSKVWWWHVRKMIVIYFKRI